MKRKTIAAMLVLALLAVPIVYALSTTTAVNFNVATVLAYTVTMPGAGPYAASGGGQATAAIEFNSSSGTDQDINAQVVGGSPQTDASAIFEFDNTGTVDLNISVILDADTAACIALRGSSVSAADANTSATLNSTVNMTVVNDFTPAAAAQSFWLKADFTGCTAGDSGTRTVTSSAVQS